MDCHSTVTKGFSGLVEYLLKNSEYRSHILT